MVSVAVQARRALVTVQLALAAAYRIVFSVTRDATDDAVLAAYKRVLRRAHPDKGGSKADAQKLLGAKEAWDRAKAPRGRPRQADKPARSNKVETNSLEPADPEQARRTFRILSRAVLLIYNEQWRRKGVTNWCATLETPRNGKLHIHLMLQFTADKERDTR